MTGQTSERLLQAIGKFSQQQEAHKANSALQAAGFSPEQVSVMTQEQGAAPGMSETEVNKSAIGGAFAGAVLGSGVGFLVSLCAINFHAPESTMYAHPALIVIIATVAGGLVAAAAMSVVAAVTGTYVPKEQASSNPNSLSRNYLVVVKGKQDDVQKAREIMRQQGGLV